MRAEAELLVQGPAVPEIRKVLSEIQTIRVEIRRLDEKTNFVRTELEAEMEARIGALSDRIGVALELRERILKLETHLEALAGKVQGRG